MLIALAAGVTVWVSAKLIGLPVSVTFWTIYIRADV